MVGYIALGSNVGDRAAYLREGLERLAAAGVEILAASSVWETQPVGETGPGWFLNMAARVRTDRSPEELLDLCLAIEGEAGRVRGSEPGPRTLDIDLLLFEGFTRATERLTLPHPRMWERGFVLAPLAELMPEVREALEALKDPHAVRLYSAAP